MSRLLFFLLLAPLCLEAATLRVLSWDHAIAARKLAVAWDEKPVIIEAMHPSARSQPVKLPRDGRQIRLLDLDKSGEDGRPLALPLPIPEGGKELLAILIADPDSPLGLRIFVTSDDPASFPWGRIRFLNATGKELVFTCGDQAVPIAPTWKPRDYSPGPGKSNLVVKFFLRDQPERPLYSSIWEHRDTLRQIVIVAPQGGVGKEGPLQFKFIVQDRRDLDPEEEAGE